jgi:TonB family protein
VTFLFECTIKTSAILAIALSLRPLLRKRSAAVRHCVLAVALGLAAVTPILSLVLPSWNLRPGLIDVSRVAPVEERISVLAPSTISTRDERALPPPASAALPSPPAHLVEVIWLIGALLGAFILLTGFARLARVAAVSQPMAEGRWTRLAATISSEYRIRRRIRLLQSQNSSILVTWGVLRPELILPAGADAWPDARVAIVLRHELAHIRRFDWIVQMIAQALRVIYWFNPLLWVACHRLRLESEVACDDAALASGISGPDYAAHLLDLARALKNPYRAWSAALPMAGPSTTERRFTAMLNPALNRQALTRRVLIGTTVALLGITLPLAAFRATGQNTPLTLSGTVYDPSGGVLPGVAVTLEDAQQSKSKATTDASGRFEFASIAPGSYVLNASIAGFRSLRHEFELRQARDWDQPITLQVGTLQETVSVTARRTPGTQAGSAAPVRVGGSLRPPHKIQDVKPIYPQAMRDAGYEGVVPMEAAIGRDGTVVSVRVVSAQVRPEFAMAAVDAVRQWRFESTLLNGEQVEVVMTVSVRFSLTN